MRFLIEHADDDATAQDKHGSRTDHWQLCYIGASPNDHMNLARFLVEHGANFRFLAPRLCLSREIKPPDASWTPPYQCLILNDDDDLSLVPSDL